MPQQRLLLTSQSSIIHPLDQWGPISPSWYAAGGAQVVAAFVEKNGIGITVDSLKELPEKLKSITDDQYAAMRRQAEQFHPLLTAGFYFNRAVDTAWNLFEEDRKR